MCKDLNHINSAQDMMNGNKLPSSIKIGEFLNQPSNISFSQKGMFHGSGYFMWSVKALTLANCCITFSTYYVCYHRQAANYYDLLQSEHEYLTFVHMYLTVKLNLLTGYDAMHALHGPVIFQYTSSENCNFYFFHFHDNNEPSFSSAVVTQGKTVHMDTTWQHLSTSKTTST